MDGLRAMSAHASLVKKTAMPGTGREQRAPRSPLQGWFTLLCQTLPDLEHGAVVQVRQGRCVPTPISWPAGAEIRSHLLTAAEEAVKHHHKSIDLEPNNASNYHNLGSAYFRLKDFQRAKM